MSGKLEELLERVRSATGPDRELDAAVIRSLGLEEDWRFGIGRGDDWPREEITASIDTILALIERELPGAVWHVMTDYGDLNRAKIGPKDTPSASIYREDDRRLFAQADGETPALALCAAFLSAKIALSAQGRG